MSYLTDLDDEKEHNDPHKNKITTFPQKKSMKNYEKDSAFKPMKWVYES